MRRKVEAGILTCQGWNREGEGDVGDLVCQDGGCAAGVLEIVHPVELHTHGNVPLEVGIVGNEY